MTSQIDLRKIDSWDVSVAFDDHTFSCTSWRCRWGYLSTSDGHSERRKKLPFTGNFEAHGRIDDIIALVACHSAVSDISILPDVAPSLRRN